MSPTTWSLSRFRNIDYLASNVHRHAGAKSDKEHIVIKNKTLFTAAMIGYIAWFIVFCVYPSLSLIIGAIGMFLFNVAALSQTTLDSDALIKWILIGLPVTLGLICASYGMQMAAQGGDPIALVPPVFLLLLLIIGIPTLIVAAAIYSGAKLN